jgi:DNA-binding NtrC family response regulator
VQWQDIQTRLQIFMLSAVHLNLINRVYPSIDGGISIGGGSISSASKLTADFNYCGAVGTTPVFRQMIDKIARFAPTNAPVLITGETGVGKELVANMLHANSIRKQRSIVPVECSGLDPNLARSELFGHVKGAYTGADRETDGFVDISHGGTLFLDEIGDISLEIQAKLLRFLQEGEKYRVGSTLREKKDVRIIAATNKNLQEEIRKGCFRQDLYYRLKVAVVEVPPLRERKDDIHLLIEHFRTKHNKPKLAFTNPASIAIRRYNWPGNIRELENLIAGLCLLGKDNIDVADLDNFEEPNEIRRTDREQTLTPPSSLETPSILGMVMAPDEVLSLTEAGKRAQALVEIELIKQALAKCRWQRQKAASLLGITYRSLIMKIDKYKLNSD